MFISFHWVENKRSLFELSGVVKAVTKILTGVSMNKRLPYDKFGTLSVYECYLTAVLKQVLFRED